MKTILALTLTLTTLLSSSAFAGFQESDRSVMNFEYPVEINVGDEVFYRMGSDDGAGNFKVHQYMTNRVLKVEPLTSGKIAYTILAFLYDKDMKEIDRKNGVVHGLTTAAVVEQLKNCKLVSKTISIPAGEFSVCGAVSTRGGSWVGHAPMGIVRQHVNSVSYLLDFMKYTPILKAVVQ